MTHDELREAVAARLVANNEESFLDADDVDAAIRVVVEACTRPLDALIDEHARDYAGCATQGFCEHFGIDDLRGVRDAICALATAKT